MRYLLLLLFIAIVACTDKTPETNYVYLKGTLINRDSDSVMVRKNTEEFGPIIPIATDGTFSYVLESPNVEKYELIFVEEWRRFAYQVIDFYTDGDTISFELYPRERNTEHLIRGSALLDEQKAFEKLYLDGPFDNAFSQVYQKRDSMRNTGKVDSLYLQVLMQKNDSISYEASSWAIEYTENHPSLSSYYILVDLMEQGRDIGVQPSQYARSLQQLSEKFSGHPVDSLAQILYAGMSKIKPGGEYTDFTVTDMEGNAITLSEEIASNKLTLIDLWSPWCGPCIRKSREIKACYDQLKPLGFDVVGVAGGFSKEEELTKAIVKHAYPWKVGLEVNNKNRIWDKYNLTGGGGGQFLVDSDGIIVSIEPKPEEILAMLSEQ